MSGMGGLAYSNWAAWVAFKIILNYFNLLIKPQNYLKRTIITIS
jgi:hypothetical protein